MQHDGYELVHFNFAMAKRPLDHPDMAGFTSQLDAVNRLASASPGFVWTPAEGEAGDAVATFGSPLVLANMSTWRSLEDLRRFTYEGQHGLALRRRREWFDAPMVLDTCSGGCRRDIGLTGSRPKRRLEQLDAYGPTPEAFTFASDIQPTRVERPDQGSASDDRRGPRSASLLLTV